MRGDACVSVNRKVEIYGKVRTKLNVADSEDGMGKGRGAEDTFFPLYIFVFLHYVHAYGKNSRLKISTMQTLKRKKRTWTYYHADSVGRVSLDLVRSQWRVAQEEGVDIGMKCRLAAEVAEGTMCYKAMSGRSQRVKSHFRKATEWAPSWLPPQNVIYVTSSSS